MSNGDDKTLRLDLGVLEAGGAAPVPDAPKDITGRLVPFNESEQHRHECEVRHVAAMSRERREVYCEGVQKHRGRPAAKRLWRAAEAYLEPLNK